MLLSKVQSKLHQSPQEGRAHEPPALTGEVCEHPQRGGRGWNERRDSLRAYSKVYLVKVSSRHEKKGEQV